MEEYVPSTVEMLSSGLTESVGVGKGTVGAIAASVTGIGVALKSFTTIPEGSVGIKTRFGKVRRHRRGQDKGQPVIRGPGAHPTFPGVHSYRIISVQRRSNDLEPSGIEVMDADAESSKRNLKASIGWHVLKEGLNPYLAEFGVVDGDLTQTVTNVSLGALRKLFESGHSVDSPEADLLTALQNQCGERLLTIGVALVDLSIKDTTRSEAQVLVEGLGVRSDDTDPKEGGSIATVLSILPNSGVEDPK